MPRAPADLVVPPTPGSKHPAVTVGVLMSIALVILVSGALWLGRASGPVYYAELAEAPGLRVGAPVRYRGMSVGQVEDIAFTDTSLRITIRLGRDDVPLREGAAVRVGRMGILGDFDLELVPSATPSAPVLAPGSTLARAAPDSARLAQEAQAKAAFEAMARDIVEQRKARGGGATATARPDSTTSR